MLANGYNQGVKVAIRHPWNVSTSRAREIQESLAAEVERSGDVNGVRFIAGVDISVKRELGEATGAVVVLEYPGLQVVETNILRSGLDFPYVPGLLSFREAPLILEACAGLKTGPQLIMVDGQGIAHPRRLGLASHLGLFLNVPTIGCAKSRLCGQHDTPGLEAGSYAEITDRGETIGAVVRTRRGVKPMYISIGHMISLESAIGWVLKCGRGYRLPEPTRLAHLAAGGNLKPGGDTV